jgi:O-antigen ligase
VIFVLVILAKGKPWWWAIPHVAVLFALGSRGAILGLSVGLLVWKRPRLTWGQAALFTTVGLGVLWVLTIYRAQEAFNRFAYWSQALDALVDHNIWLGLGPGGIAARRVILEPGSLPGPGGFHLHAHNFIVQWTAETGLVGLTALLIALVWILKARIHWRWQLPILAAILVHCLVDFPLYYPGPLLVFMAIAGSEYSRLTNAAHSLPYVSS